MTDPGLRSVAGAVLCGGASRRMGRDKSLIEVAGVAMVVSVATALRAAGCDPVVAIGGDRVALEALGLEVVADGFPGEGPLGGVITALRHFGSDEAVLVTACDLPRLSAQTLARVLSSPGGDVVLATTDRVQPTCALWRRSALVTLQGAFIAGERRLTSVISGLRTVEVPVNPQDLANANTPGDLPQ